MSPAQSIRVNTTVSRTIRLATKLVKSKEVTRNIQTNDREMFLNSSDFSCDGSLIEYSVSKQLSLIWINFGFVGYGVYC